MPFRIRSAVFAFAMVSTVSVAFCTVTFCSVASAQNGAPAQALQHQPTSTAVVDMDFILDNHPTFTAQAEALKAEYQKTMEDFEARKKAVQQEYEQLTSTLSADSPEYKQKQESLVQRDSKMRLEAVNKEKELTEKRAKLMLDTYNQIVERVAGAAQYYKYDMVVRYSRRQASQMNPKNPQTVMIGADREVIYFNPNYDLTDTIIAMLKRDIPAAAPTSTGKAPQTANASSLAPNANGPAGTLRK